MKINWIWIFISVFIIIFFGYDLCLAIFEGKINSITYNRFINFDREYVAFIAIFTVRLVFVLACFVFLYKEARKLK